MRRTCTLYTWDVYTCVSMSSRHTSVVFTTHECCPHDTRVLSSHNIIKLCRMCSLSTVFSDLLPGLVAEVVVLLHELLRGNLGLGGADLLPHVHVVGLLGEHLGARLVAEVVILEPQSRHSVSAPCIHVQI